MNQNQCNDSDIYEKRLQMVGIINQKWALDNAVCTRIYSEIKRFNLGSS